MNIKKRTYSQYAKDAAVLLGKSIKLARIERRFTTTDFAERVGISRVTLQKIEKGDLKCEIGIVFEAAALAGVPLFNVETIRGKFSKNLESVNDKLALLPQSVRKGKQDIENDF